MSFVDDAPEEEAPEYRSMAKRASDESRRLQERALEHEEGAAHLPANNGADD